jgi:hypothetical protein
MGYVYTFTFKVTLSILLNGDPDINVEMNKAIFGAVHYLSALET